MEKIKILAVDDEAGILNIFRNVLGKYGDYDIATGTSVTEALKLIIRERFDIFLIDYQMNDDSTGITLLKLIQEEYREKDYVSILFTTHGTGYLLEDEKNQGVFDLFVEKPFKVDNFLQVFYRGLIELGKRRKTKIILTGLSFRGTLCEN